ncbi:MAG: hypothetical protein AAGA54_37640 [Myxococcota bacterium]
MIECPKCGTRNAAHAQFCEGCGESFANFVELDDQLADMLAKEARKGAWALGFVALATAILPLVIGFANAFTYGVAAVFGVLALWALKAPLIASAIGLSLYGVAVLADAVADPSTILRGILGKIIVVTVLVNAIRAGMKHREFQKQRGRG